MLKATNKSYFFILLLIGTVVYFPIFFNGFVWDDLAFILLNPQVHQFNLLTAFGPNIFNTEPFYRPIPATYFALLYAMFGQNAFFYHLIQLLLHCIDAYLVFVFFKLFFVNKTSLILSIIFLVHPINVESVAFISSIASELSLLFALSAFLLATPRQLSGKRLLSISILLFLGVLTKETGVLVFMVILAYRFLYKLNKLEILTGIGGGVILLYFLFRASNSISLNNIYSWIPIANLPFTTRLLNIPAIITYYLQTTVFPLNLSISQIWVVTQISSITFLIPFLVCLLLGTLLGFLLYQTKKQNEQSLYKTLLFFSLWFGITMLPFLQLIPLEMTVADRWFYTTLIGLLGIVGVLAKNFSRYNQYLTIGAILIIILLSIRTFIRTFDWHDDVTINKHDVQHQKNNFILMDDLAMAYLREGRTDEALKYERQSLSISPQAVTTGHLGNIYYAQKKFALATAEYNKAIKIIGNDPTGQFAGSVQQYYMNMVAIKLHTEHPHEAITLLKNHALKQLPQDHVFYILLAYAYYKAGDQQQAINAAAQAYQLYPNNQYATFYERLQHNLPVNINLGE